MCVCVCVGGGGINVDSLVRVAVKSYTLHLKSYTYTLMTQIMSLAINNINAYMYIRNLFVWTVWWHVRNSLWYRSGSWKCRRLKSSHSHSWRIRLDYLAMETPPSSLESYRILQSQCWRQQNKSQLPIVWRCMHFANFVLEHCVGPS